LWELVSGDSAREMEKFLTLSKSNAFTRFDMCARLQSEICSEHRVSICIIQDRLV
jgi:hypothetical protein